MLAAFGPVLHHALIRNNSTQTQVTRNKRLRTNLLDPIRLGCARLRSRPAGHLHLLFWRSPWRYRLALPRGMRTTRSERGNWSRAAPPLLCGQNAGARGCIASEAYTALRRETIDDSIQPCFDSSSGCRRTSHRRLPYDSSGACGQTRSASRPPGRSSKATTTTARPPRQSPLAPWKWQRELRTFLRTRGSAAEDQQDAGRPTAGPEERYYTGQPATRGGDGPAAGSD